MARIGIAGVSGRMGQMLVAMVQTSEGVQLAGVSEHPDHPWIGQELASVSRVGSADLIVQANPEVAFQNVDAILDFTTPSSSVALSSVAARMGATHVIGTTGFSETELRKIAANSRKTTIVRAGNMSMGVNLLVRLSEKVASALDEEFDIEILEAHHRHKVDAPSGTALMLGEAAAKGRNVLLREVEDRGRDGNTGARTRGTIGFSAVRGGDIVGEHDVIFAAEGERIILRHIATDRSIYARGALKAGIWGIAQPAGEYDMCDVLGL